MEKYRELLQKLENEAQDQYDKTVLYLSTGALGISFTFLKDIVSVEHAIDIEWLIAAWLSWAVSVSAILWSFFSSRIALRNAIKAIDEGRSPDNKIDAMTTIFNLLSGILFIVGLICIIVFVTKNLEANRMSQSVYTQDGKNIPQMPKAMEKGQNIPQAPVKPNPQPQQPSQQSNNNS